MKWFQHYSTAHKNLKFQALIEKYGFEGYGFYWVLCELVAEQGRNYSIPGSKNWRKYFKNIFGENEEKLEEFLKNLASWQLISSKALKNGALAIPKMKEYSSDYQKRVRRVFEHSSDNVLLEEKRREKKKIEEKKDDFSKKYLDRWFPFKKL